VERARLTRQLAYAPTDYGFANAIYLLDDLRIFVAMRPDELRHGEDPAAREVDRLQSSDDETGGRRRSQLLFGLSVLLFASGFGATHLRMLADRKAENFRTGEVQYRLWVIVLAVTVGGAVALFPHHWAWLAALRKFVTPKMAIQRIVLLNVVVIAGAILFFEVLSVNGLSGDQDLDKQLVTATRPLLVGSWLATLLGWSTFLAISSFARGNEFWTHCDDSSQVKQVLRLRRELRRLLTSFGALLALLVISTGMRRHAILALKPKDNAPVEFVVLYGLAFAALLGSMYLVANNAVSARADRIVDKVTPLPQPSDPRFSDLLRHREDLAGLMTPSGAFESFQTVVFIAGPLISALVGSAVGK
jgi:hypothetical protein